MAQRLNSKKIGGRFEGDVQSSIPRMYDVERLKDSPTHYKKVHNPADYIVFTGKQLIYLECKTTKDKSFPLANIRMEQLDKMIVKATKQNVVCGYIIELREYNKCFFIEVGQLCQYILGTKSKSIPYQWIRDNGYQVARQLKISRYRYGIIGLFRYLEEEKYVNN